MARQTLDEVVAVTILSPAQWLPAPDSGAQCAELWEERGVDYAHGGLSSEAALNKTLCDIRALLRERGMQLDNFNLPVPVVECRKDWGTLEMERRSACDQELEQREFGWLFALIKDCFEAAESVESLARRREWRNGKCCVSGRPHRLWQKSSRGAAPPAVGLVRNSAGPCHAWHSCFSLTWRPHNAQSS